MDQLESLMKFDIPRSSNKKKEKEKKKEKKKLVCLG
jgi:hypothetical protein